MCIFKASDLFIELCLKNVIFVIILLTSLVIFAIAKRIIFKLDGNVKQSGC